MGLEQRAQLIGSGARGSTQIGAVVESARNWPRSFEIGAPNRPGTSFALENDREQSHSSGQRTDSRVAEEPATVHTEARRVRSTRSRRSREWALAARRAAPPSPARLAAEERALRRADEDAPAAHVRPASKQAAAARSVESGGQSNGWLHPIELSGLNSRGRGADGTAVRVARRTAARAVQPSPAVARVSAASRKRLKSGRTPIRRAGSSDLHGRVGGGSLTLRSVCGGNGRLSWSQCPWPSEHWPAAEGAAARLTGALATGGAGQRRATIHNHWPPAH